MVSDSEQTVVDYFTGLLDAAKWQWRLVIYRGRKGCPDILCAGPYNRMFLVEMKRPKGGRLDPLQVEDHAEWFKVGVLVQVVWTREHADAFMVRHK